MSTLPNKQRTASRLTGDVQTPASSLIKKDNPTKRIRSLREHPGKPHRTPNGFRTKFSDIKGTPFQVTKPFPGLGILLRYHNWTFHNHEATSDLVPRKKQQTTSKRAPSLKHHSKLRPQVVGHEFSSNFVRQTNIKIHTCFCFVSNIGGDLQMGRVFF